jgi:hypothetical protein
MKVQKWTAGLAAAGVVSLASVAQAEETKSSLETALSGTTLSGYVDVGYVWNVGGHSGNLAPATSFWGTSKGDGFNLNVVNLKLEKPLDDSGWAAGYTVELWLGPDANALGSASANSIGGLANQGAVAAGAPASIITSSDFAIKQAFVALRAPVGNGLDFKVGVFDTIIGYEVANGPSNPNISRSFGISVEPFQHTGLLASYSVMDGITLNAGLAGQGASSTINGRNFANPARLAYMASVAITAPEDSGFLAGSALYAGLVAGEDGGNNDDRVNYYLGGTMATPIAGLSVGAAFDYVQDPAAALDNITVYGLYASFAASEKLSFHGRTEYLDLGNGGVEQYEFTLTAQYNLWENVLTRIEARYDYAVNGNAYGGNIIRSPINGAPLPPALPGVFVSTGPVSNHAYSVLAQIVYKF